MNNFTTLIEYQEWRASLVRPESEILFGDLIEAITATREAMGKEICFFHYSSAIDAVTEGLFGKSVKTICEELGISDKDLTHDCFNDKAIWWLFNTQEIASYLIYDSGMNAVDAVKKTIENCHYQVPIEYKR